MKTNSSDNLEKNSVLNITNKFIHCHGLPTLFMSHIELKKCIS